MERQRTRELETGEGASTTVRDEPNESDDGGAEDGVAEETVVVEVHEARTPSSRLDSLAIAQEDNPSTSAPTTKMGEMRA